MKAGTSGMTDPGNRLLPPHLKRGDTIGIVSPSGVVDAAVQGKLEAGVAAFEGMGFQVAFARNARSATLGYSATPEEKAADIHQLFCDPAIAAVVCSQGGATSNACLPLLDWDLLRAHPKVFLGISDITVLLNAIHARTGLVTFHGSDLIWGFGSQPASYDFEEFTGRLVDGRIGPVRAAGPRETLRAGVAEGRLLGGNVGCLRHLLGTPCLPDFTGAILFLESFSYQASTAYAWFHHLDQAGVLPRIAGAVIGYIHEDAARADERLADVFMEVARRHAFPVLKTVDFGHVCPNTVLPVGARVRLDAGAKELVILEPCVR